MRVVIATQNKGKLEEMQAMLAGLDMELLSLDNYLPFPEIEEDGSSYRENALKKARIIAESTGEIALADDSGLEVDALYGAPGIYSSRYAGEGATDESNIRKLLANMKDVPPEKRGAAYYCVLVFYRPDGTYETFTGRWEGQIHDVPLGEGGFGYDPVFLLTDRGVTAAQLPVETKNKLSHRGQAFAMLRGKLQK